MGREYQADLRRRTLGGRWTSPSAGGGWWCVQLSDTVADDINVERTNNYDLMPPLLASRMATPNYPVRAIREALEGRAVVCFLVDNNGAIIDPHIVELTDEIFRTDDALGHRPVELRRLGQAGYRATGLPKLHL